MDAGQALPLVGATVLERVCSVADSALRLRPAVCVCKVYYRTRHLYYQGFGVHTSKLHEICALCTVYTYTYTLFISKSNVQVPVSPHTTTFPADTGSLSDSRLRANCVTCVASLSLSMSLSLHLARRHSRVAVGRRGPVLACRDGANRLQQRLLRLAATPHSTRARLMPSVEILTRCPSIATLRT